MLLHLRREHALVGVVAVEYSLMLAWMNLQVMGVRRKYEVKYPTLYARIGEGKLNDHQALMEYNCTQRGHQNTLERAPSFMILTFLGGLRYPVCTAIAAQIWLASRVAYFLGYATGDPEKRSRGAFGLVGELGLLVFAIGTCAEPFLH
eukprot:m.160468 g.160468  ORF g.160468 m.160468 type:complete len:148 (+) comp16361_c0_seq6:604-1047(+)